MRPHAVFRPALLALAAAVALMAAGQANAQGAPALTVNQVDAGAYPDLRVVATVLDANGVPVPGLGTAQFHAFEGDAPLQVADVQRAQDASLPLSVVVALDVSGSMAGEPLVQAKQAAEEFVRQLGPADLAAVVVFNQQVTTQVPFTNDRVLLTNGFATLQAGGGTALYRAVEASAFAARTASSPRRAVVLLTDGQNDTPDTESTRDGSLAAAKAAGVPMFTVGFGAAPDAQYLQALATATSGLYLPATTADVTAVYGTIAALLRNQYVLTVRATAPADGGQASLRVTADVGGTTVAATATYQRGAPAPVPTARPQPSPAAAGGAGQGGRGRTPLVVFTVIVLVLVAGGGGYFAFAWVRRRRLLRHQLQVVAPNPVRAAAQPLPQQAGAMPRAGGTLAGKGRLVEKAADGERVHALGAGPAVIGSARRRCTIVLPEGEDVAPEHVRIWLREGRYLLHHAGGPRRRTLVNGREADWVQLEEGDELQVGPHRFVFEES